MRAVPTSCGLTSLALLLLIGACDEGRKAERVYWTSVLNDAQMAELKKTAPAVRIFDAMFNAIMSASIDAPC